MKIRTIVFTLVLLSNVYAEDNTRHFEVAKEHVLINLSITSPHEIAESVTDGLLMQQPQNKPFREVFIAFFEKIYTSDEYIDSYAKLYMNELSIEELEYANKVFSDPKIKSYMKKAPTINGKVYKNRTKDC